jgi:putative endonuclease
MQNHIETGKMGEDLAVDWLLKNGYTIRERNWRNSHCEIDIIAAKNGCLHIVEVKTRRSLLFGGPELSVNPKKFYRLQKATRAYTRGSKIYRWLQFDIVAVTLLPNKLPLIELFEDIYF